jgi:hypothetical protein
MRGVTPLLLGVSFRPQFFMAHALKHAYAGIQKELSSVLMAMSAARSTICKSTDTRNYLLLDQATGIRDLNLQTR